MNTYERWLASMLRAEVVCAELLEKNLSFDKIRYAAGGAFKKSFRTDVDTISDTDNGIEITVNRDGIYDRLPEGLFHQTRGNSGSKVSEMVAEHKRYKAEEKNARRFFSPFEQEFFRYGVLIEREERKLTSGMYDERMQLLLKNLWDLDDDLPKAAAAMIIRMMPWAYNIKGDLELTAKTLELILDQPVFSQEIIAEQTFSSQHSFSLGENALGMDTLAGNSISSRQLLWKFTIKDIAINDVSQYTPQKSYGLLLKRFEEIFIPLDVDAVFEYETKTVKEGEAAEAVLGFSLTI